MALRIVRGDKVKLTFPDQIIKTDNKGRLWCKDMPILGITDTVEKANAVKSVKEKKWDDISDTAYTRIGNNPNGLWAGWDEEWENHPLKTKQDAKRKEEKEKQKKQRRVYLSSRGWGDYGSVEWNGDITRPENEILAECYELLKNGHDVDRPNQTPEEILKEIRSEKAKYQKNLDGEQAERNRVATLNTEIDALNVTVKVIKSSKKQSGEGDGCNDYYAHVEVTDKKTGDTLKFNCRNIFDFGYVVNPDYKITPEMDEPGGLANFDKKTGKYFWDDFKDGKGWHSIREMTDFESRAYTYLSKRPPIYDGINM